MPRLSKIGAACLAAFGYSGGTLTTANYLVVAGGGGGAYNGGGGGGAGGLIIGIQNLNPTLSYVITVGAGGLGSNGATANNGTNGSNSVFSTFSTAIGGGKGGDIQNNGFTGGSGGGGGTGYNNNAPGTGGSGTVGQGNAGGAGRTLTVAVPASIAGGGGGGASAVGNVGGSAIGGTGGAGTASSISGSSVTYAGGGAGGAGTSVAAGGAGGGGNGGGGSTAATSGSTNTGGGGGGGGNPATTGGNGGSGVVIISYTSPTQIFGGGNVTFVGGNWIHTFTTSGTLVPASTFTADFLVIAGGGGGAGGANGSGGGGGAGGYRTSATSLDINSNYIVSVGAGGSGSTINAVGGQGSNSAFFNITSNGGGYGGYSSSGATGGSGGGSGNNGAGLGTFTGAAGNTPSTTPSQGNNGGANFPANAAWVGGGGGGASAVGSTGSSGVAGTGGAGTASSITGSSVTRAGGGGGGSWQSGTSGGTGGAGGGGNGGKGASSGGSAATANTGSGGGGGGQDGTGGAGGSGVVIISYAGAQRMAGGTVTFVGGNTIHTFTSSGYLSALKLVNNSLRFKASTTSYLNRTPSAATNQTVWTFSAWVKRGTLSTLQTIFEGYTNGSNASSINFTAADQIQVSNYVAASLVTNKITTAVFRDPAAWYHIVVASNGVTSLNVYVNGVQITTFTTNVGPTAANWFYNGANAHMIGRESSGGTGIQYFDGYLTEFNWIDGQQLTPSSFGGFNSYGVWQPTQYLGSYGTNGFYLPFTNNASSTTIGYDFSPNQNNWTSTGFTLTPTTSVLYDSMTDVPTLTSATASNWCVANPLDAATGLTINDGNLKLAASAAGSKFVRSSIALPSSGAFYAELTFANASSASIGETIGICTAARSLTAANNAAGAYLFYASALGALISNGTTLASSLTAISANELFQVAIDVTNSKMWIGRTNAWYNSTGGTTGNPSTGANPTFTGSFVDYFIYAGFDTASAVSANINFGQRPFVGTVPTGFVALNTFNM